MFLFKKPQRYTQSSDWAKEFDGLSVLSHLTSTSGGVAILFSKNCIPCSYQVEEVIKGRLLKVVAQFENCSFILSVCMSQLILWKECFF